MVSSVSGILTTAKRYSGYGANFILGTGSEVIGKEVQVAVKARKSLGQGLGESIFTGFSKGVKASNAQVAQTGFFKSVRKAFTSLPHNMSEGWKTADVAGKNIFSKYFSKIGASLKPIGKVMPLAFNALMLLSSVPSMMERAQDEGIWGGIKEAGKAIGKMGLYALGSALGAAFGGVGAFAGVAVAGLAADSIFGKDYSTEKDEKLKKYNEFVAAQQGSDVQTQGNQINFNA